MTKPTDASDVAAGPIVAIPPPPPALRDSVARLIVEILARQVLSKLGVAADARSTPRQEHNRARATSEYPRDVPGT